MSGWNTPSRCGSGHCVEWLVSESHVLVRDSKDREGSRLRFTRQEWLEFLDAVRSGEADMEEA